MVNSASCEPRKLRSPCPTVAPLARGCLDRLALTDMAKDDLQTYTLKKNARPLSLCSRNASTRGRPHRPSGGCSQRNRHARYLPGEAGLLAGAKGFHDGGLQVDPDVRRLVR